VSLDLYCGSLSKFYSRDFETPQAKFARENGFEYQLVYEGEPIDWFNPVEARDKADAFIEKLTSRLGEKENTCRWDDKRTEYAVEQLHVRSLSALLLTAAYLYRSDLQRPEHVPEGFESDPAYEESSDREYYIGPLAILESHIFLPCDADSLFWDENPLGFDKFVTTTGNLRYALNWLADKRWNGNVEADKWFNRGPAPSAGKTLVQEKSIVPWRKKWRDKFEEVPANSLNWDAEYAFGCFSRLLDFSDRTGLPLLMDV
tara:strand:- start:1169 stop:1945 length:777 start_codon:yes stop_codon:yes gene_type:complete